MADRSCREKTTARVLSVHAAESVAISGTGLQKTNEWSLREKWVIPISVAPNET